MHSTLSRNICKTIFAIYFLIIQTDNHLNFKCRYLHNVSIGKKQQFKCNIIPIAFYLKILKLRVYNEKKAQECK